MDSAGVHDFGFNEAISFIVHCRSRAETVRSCSLCPEKQFATYCRKLPIRRCRGRFVIALRESKRHIHPGEEESAARTGRTRECADKGFLLERVVDAAVKFEPFSQKEGGSEVVHH